jgi:hypothetical protein
MIYFKKYIFNVKYLIDRQIVKTLLTVITKTNYKQATSTFCFKETNKTKKGIKIY